MDINELKKEIIEEQKVLEEDAFKLFCIDTIRDLLKRKDKVKEDLNKVFERINNLTEESLRKDFESLNYNMNETYKQQYINKILTEEK